MFRALNSGRPNQKQRTRKDLLDAAVRLSRAGERPNLEAVAEAALVSRATAYRYFPSIEALLLEASVHMAAPDLAILDDAPATDAVARARVVDEAFSHMTRANEAPLRLMLARSLERNAKGEMPADLPARQNRRTPLIEAALDPIRERIAPETYRKLVHALALVIGTESFVVTRDVLRLSDSEARELRSWAIEALVESALLGQAA